MMAERPDIMTVLLDYGADINLLQAWLIIIMTALMTNITYSRVYIIHVMELERSYSFDGHFGDGV